MKIGLGLSKREFATDPIFNAGDLIVLTPDDEYEYTTCFCYEDIKCDKCLYERPLIYLGQRAHKTIGLYLYFAFDIERNCYVRLTTTSGFKVLSTFSSCVES